jgi:hypothetical protein
LIMNSTPNRTDRSNTDDEANAEFHELLRAAAEKREGRERVRQSEDAVAAKRESDDLLTLALGVGRQPARIAGARSERRRPAPEKARLRSGS